MKLNREDMDNLELDTYIDMYLDGVLSEAEMDNFEIKCLEDKLFFKRVQEREEFRGKVENIIKEDGGVIFKHYINKEQSLRSQSNSISIIHKVFQIWANLRPIWRYALIPAGVVALFLMIFIFRSNGMFNENPGFERMLGKSSFRAGQSEIEIIAPAIGGRMNGTIEFRWNTSAQGPFAIIILNNKGEEIKEFRNNDKTYIYRDSLPPGLYYWKLLIGDEWVYTGKFFVKKK